MWRLVFLHLTTTWWVVLFTVTFQKEILFFFSPEKYFEYCFCLSTFSPIVYRPAQSYLQKLYNRNYNHRKISSHTYYVIITCGEILDFRKCCWTKCSSEYCSFFILHIVIIFPLMNALVYGDIDQGIHCGKIIAKSQMNQA